MLVQVTYRSKAAFPQEHMSNLDILREALVRNRKQGITGFLTRDRSHFLQIIEGDAEPVDNLISAIGRDGRCSQMDVLQRKICSERVFGQWSMGYSEIARPKDSRIMDLTFEESLALLQKLASYEQVKIQMYCA